MRELIPRRPIRTLRSVFRSTPQPRNKEQIMSTSVTNVMFNTAPLLGAGVSLSALSAAVGTALKVYAGAAVGALALLRVVQLRAAQLKRPAEPEAYPFAAPEPWDFDGSPRGLE
jgi:hypothetical protein